MSDDFGGFAPPPFDADKALVALRRSMRDLGLTERGNGFELRGKRVVELAVADGRVDARVARRPMATPEWDRKTIASAIDQRKVVDEMRTRLAKWQREDD